MYLIVGLGNPGTEYENTRHNAGFRAVEALAQKLGVETLKRKKKCDAYVSEASIGGTKVILAQPQTFMNNSGTAISSLLQWYKIDPTHLILIYDDLDLEAGQIRIRESGGAGGHHGVESAIRHTGSTEFPRVRIGIGRPEHGDAVNYVLGKFTTDQGQSSELALAFANAADAIVEIISAGVPSAMNKFNK